jgi:hypothetical protein
MVQGISCEYRTTGFNGEVLYGDTRLPHLSCVQGISLYIADITAVPAAIILPLVRPFSKNPYGPLLTRDTRL